MQLKFVMAVTGAVMLAYLVAHMLGNLKIFFGEEALNTYAHWLRLIGEPALPGEGMLWIIRVVLLVVGGRAHRRGDHPRPPRPPARPVKYAHRRPVSTSYASRTMRWGGVIILLFVIYHILDLTTGTLNPNGVPGEVYDNVVADFSPLVRDAGLHGRDGRSSGFHLRHGIWSALQTLGRSSGPYQMRYKAIALVFAVVLTAGFLAVPFAVQFGLVGVL